MKKYLLLCSLCFSLRANSITFDSIAPHAQMNIEKHIKSCIFTFDIAIIQPRCDEMYRDYDSMELQFKLASLRLNDARLLEVLKGHKDFQKNPLVYLYSSLGLTEQETIPVQNTAGCFQDDCMRFVFLKNQYTPLIDILRFEKNPFIVSLLKDTQFMPAQDYLRKYNLSDVFTNRVYYLYTDCSFLVDYKEPDLKTTPLVAEKLAANKEFINADRTKLQGTHSILQPIHLSHSEVSEIVHIAYLLEGKDGQKAYDEAVKGSAILQPVKQGAYTTLIGKRLYEALKEDIEKKKF